MNKISINGYFKNYEIKEKIIFNSIGNLVNKNIVFKQESDLYKIIFKENRIVFNRDTNNAKLMYEFKLNETTTGEYMLKELNSKIKLSVYTMKMNVTNNIVRVEFKVNDMSNKKSILYLEYEVVNS